MAVYPSYLSHNWDSLLKTYIDAAVSTVVSMASFGAVGDGTTDDTTAVRNAIASGQTLNWGGPEKVYRITDTLTLTLTADRTIVANGATVRLDSTTPVQRMVDVEHGGFSLQLIGALHLDANRKAFQGLYCGNNSTTAANLSLQNLTVENAYRGSAAFSGGDGIFIEGCFDHIKLINPTIRNVTMASGAGTTGVQGVTGLTIHSLGETKPWKHVTITTPFVENVYSEDTAYQADQDGIRIMSAEDDGAILYPYDSDFTIDGAKFHNCQGRAVKSQTEYGSVTNARIYRDRNVGAAWGTDIDFQVGGGYVENIYCRYIGNAPQQVVNFSGSVTASKVVPHGSLRGLRINQSGTYAPQFVVQSSPRNQLQSTTILDDVEYLGTVAPTNMVRMAAIAGGVHDLYASKIIGSSTSHFFATAGDVSAATGSWSFRDIINLGSAVNLVSGSNDNFKPEVSAAGMIRGFNSWNGIDGTRTTADGVQRIKALGPVANTPGDGSVPAGLLRMLSKTLAAEDTWHLPDFATSHVGLLFVSVAGDVQGQAILKIAGTGVTLVNTNGDINAINGTADTGVAGDGKFAIWGGSSSGPWIANHSVNTKTLTVLMFG